MTERIYPSRSKVGKLGWQCVMVAFDSDGRSAELRLP